MRLRAQVRRAVASRLGKDVLLTFAAQLFVMLSVFVVNKLVSVGLGVEGFSSYSLIRKNSALFASLFALGLTEALTHFYAYQQGRRSSDEVLGALFREAIRLLLYSMLFFLLLFVVLRSPLSATLFDSESAWRELGLVYLFAVGSCVYQLLCSYYLGLGDFKRAGLVQVGINSVYLLVAVFFSGSVQLLFVLWSVLSLVPLVIVILVELHRYPSIRRATAKRLRRVERRRLLFYGSTRMGSNLVLYGMDVLPLVIILHRYGERSVSLFSVSITVLLMVTPIFAFTSSLFLQRVSMMRAAGSYRAISRLIRWASIPFVAIAVVGGVFLYFFSEEVIKVLYTEEFLDAGALIAITAVALLPKAFFYLLKSPLDGLSERPYMLGVLSVSLLFYALLLWRSESLQSCAWAYVWTKVVMMVLTVAVWYVLLSRRLRGEYEGVKDDYGRCG